ncbi:MAG: hypothetical protein ACRD2W_19840 [Acidimicrobiales bacterium]
MPAFPFASEHAQWSDVLVLAAAVAWLVEQRQAGFPFRIRVPHVAVGVYLVASGASLLVSPARHRGLLLLAGMAGLGALFVLTSELTSDQRVHRAFVRTLAATAFLLGAASVVGLALFYAGRTTRLVGAYGDLVASTRYARAQAGFYHPNLLASFCTFASAGLAGAADDLPPRVRRAAQAVLAVVVLTTFSRAILGFFVALAIRAGAGSRRGRIAAASAFVAVAIAVATLTLVNVEVDPSRPLAASFSSEPSNRRQAAETSLDTLADHPFLGNGLGSYPGSWDRGLAPAQAHFTPLEIAAVQGPWALLALVTLIVVLWQRRRRPTDVATWSGLAAMALDALAMDIHRFRHVWVLLGRADACRTDRQQDRANVSA